MRFFGENKGAVEVLISLNIVVFVAELIAKEWSYKNLALQAATALAKPWTIVSSMFMHAGFGHLAFNMIALFFFGLYLERLLGEEHFLEVYFIGGAFASISYVLTSMLFGVPSPYVYAVGASGAIFAVTAALAVLRPNLTVYVYFLFPMPLWVFTIGYVLMAVPALFTPIGNVAHNAHLGGLIAGYLLGRHFKDKITQYPNAGMYGYRFV